MRELLQVFSFFVYLQSNIEKKKNKYINYIRVIG